MTRRATGEYLLRRGTYGTDGAGVDPAEWSDGLPAGARRTAVVQLILRQAGTPIVRTRTIELALVGDTASGLFVAGLGARARVHEGGTFELHFVERSDCWSLEGTLSGRLWHDSVSITWFMWNEEEQSTSLKRAARRFELLVRPHAVPWLERDR